jgi:protocatechuate 3,4-dioxygenase beta subunit
MPIAGATVYAYLEVWENATRTEHFHGHVATQQDGSYVLTDLPDGELRVRAFAPKMYPREWKPEVEELRKEAHHDFLLTPAPVLIGTIADSEVRMVWFRLQGSPLTPPRMRGGWGGDRISGKANVREGGRYEIVLVESKRYRKDEGINDISAFEQPGQQSEHWEGRKEQGVLLLSESLTYELAIRPEGYEPVYYPHLGVTRGEVKHLDVEPQMRSRYIEGRVVRASGRPVVGMEITLREESPTVAKGWLTSELSDFCSFTEFTLERSEGFRTHTDADGGFVFRDAPIGTYQILDVHEYDIPTTDEAHYTFPSVQVDVRPDIPPRYVEITAQLKPRPAEQPYVWVEGRVLDAEGRPVTDTRLPVSVWVPNPDGGWLSDDSTLTDGEGRYELRYPRAGQCWLSVYQGVKPITQQFVAKEGERVRGIDFVLKPLPDEEMPISGQVVYKAGKPIDFGSAGLKTLPSSYFRPLRIDESGRFWHDRFPSGDNELEIDFDDLFLNNETRRFPIVDGKAQNLLIQVPRLASMVVRLVSAETGEPIRSSASYDGSSLQFTGMGSGGGVFGIPSISSNTSHTIRFSAVGYESVQKEFVLEPGEHREVTIALKPTSRVTLVGRLEWPNGEPAAHVPVWFKQYYYRYGGPLLHAVTDSQGGFTFDALYSNCSCELFVNTPGFPFQREHVGTIEGGTQEFVYRIKRGTQVRGRLVFGDSIPYPARPVLTLNSVPTQAPYIRGWKPRPWVVPGSLPDYLQPGLPITEPLEDRVSFVFGRVLPEEYTLSFYDDGPPDGSGHPKALIRPMKITVGDVEEIYIEVPVKGFGELVIRVLEADTKTVIPNALIEIYPLSTNLVPLDEEGYYRTELPAGTYEAEVNSDNEDGTTAVAKETVEVIAGERTCYTIYLDKSRFAGCR